MAQREQIRDHGSWAMDRQVIDTLKIAERAIIAAWKKGDEVEKAQLAIAQDIVQEVIAQREAMQMDAANQ